MATLAKAGSRVTFKNIIFLSDFSPASEAALPFALILAGMFGGVVHALHVQLPVPIMGVSPEAVLATMEAAEECTRAGMAHLEARLVGTEHDTMVLREPHVWPALEQVITRCDADLVILGTHGRTGTNKLLLGSVAEEIVRRIAIPVLTVGPNVCASVPGGRFCNVLFATECTPEAMRGMSCALTLAEKSGARLTLLNVLPGTPDEKDRPLGLREDACVERARQVLCGLLPEEAGLRCQPETAIEFGEPSERILSVAARLNCDLIVLGVREVHHSGARTHFGGGVLHEVVAGAACPVLTIRH